MSDEKLKKVFSSNLKRQLELNDKQPVDLVNDLGIPFSTVSNWINGLKFPRMGKIELLAQYFGVEKSALIEETAPADPYYFNEDARDLAQFLYDNPEYKILFDASRKVKKEDIQFVKDLMDRMSGNE